MLNVRLSDQQVEMQNCPINLEDRFPTNRPILSSTGQVTQNLGNSMLQGHAQQQGNRYSYRAAAYRTDGQQDLG